ncbi:MAG TPA: hypothetical protein VE173_14785 [Longimicrobiales bacterium]|nr:hypothetical protein [Longimicrobiales bacterium]
MIELKHDALEFSFPEVHPDARLTVDFQRTLRIPDDERTYRLPPGLGRFPLRHVDDAGERVPALWLRRGGVMLPMYQSEAMWLDFTAYSTFPFVLKVAAGKVNAATGEDWEEGLHRSPQDYLVVPGQPWLDGYAVEKGVIRQFVAMPLGEGYSAEEQIHGTAEHGGVQLLACPMKREVYERKVAALRDMSMPSPSLWMGRVSESLAAPSMALAPGGRMRQEIYEDRYELEDWDQRHRSRCFVHLVDSLVWRAITGEAPPTTPPTAQEYTAAGLPWFDYYAADRTALEGSDILARLESVLEKAAGEGRAPLPENEPAEGERVVPIRERARCDSVREGAW